MCNWYFINIMTLDNMSFGDKHGCQLREQHLGTSIDTNPRIKIWGQASIDANLGIKIWGQKWMPT